MATEASVLTRKQSKTFGPRSIASQYGNGAMIEAKVRFDDDCNNGHNTFSVTADIFNMHAGRKIDIAGGCCHDEIARIFPELAPFIKWHLMSTDEPLHYIANTLYWLGHDSQWCKGETGDPPNLAYAKKTAVWDDMPESFLATSGEFTREQVASALTARLEGLQAEFRAAVESLGFVW
jgi:hypothetical protein